MPSTDKCQRGCPPEERNTLQLICLDRVRYFLRITGSDLRRVVFDAGNNLVHLLSVPVEIHIRLLAVSGVNSQPVIGDAISHDRVRINPFEVGDIDGSELTGQDSPRPDDPVLSESSIVTGAREFDRLDVLFCFLVNLVGDFSRRAIATQPSEEGMQIRLTIITIA